MTDLIAIQKIAGWEKLKTLVVVAATLLWLEGHQAHSCSGFMPCRIAKS